MPRLRVPALILAALLAGCGGVTPHTATSGLPNAQPLRPAAAQTVGVAFRIVPTKTPAGSARRPAYVSAATASAGVTVSAPGLAPVTTVINCSGGSCSGTVDAPVGTDTFAVSLYDQANGRGAVLSSGSATKTIVQNQANSVNITFDGVPSQVSYIAFDNAHPFIGASATTNLHVAVADPDGYTIVGPGKYATPIVLSLSDPSGSTQLSATTVTAPSDVVTLSYNGTAKITATVSGAVQGAAVTASGLFEPLNVSPEYSVPTAGADPSAAVKGPDGAIWFTEHNGRKIGKIDTTGFITQYPTAGAPSQIIAGPDGALWFTESGSASVQYGRVTTSGTVTEYTIGTAGTSTSPWYLAFGPDQNLYITDQGGNSGAIYEVTPATGAVLKTYTSPYGWPSGIVVGNDGYMWVGQQSVISKIRLSDGQVSGYQTAGSVVSMIAGADGNIWFGDWAGKIGKITPTGTVTEYDVPNWGNVWQIIGAADGTYWFTYGVINSGDPHACRIGHSTSTGTMTSYAIADCQTYLAFGADNKLWLAERNRGKIGVFTP